MNWRCAFAIAAGFTRTGSSHLMFHLGRTRQREKRQVMICKMNRGKRLLPYIDDGIEFMLSRNKHKIAACCDADNLA